MRGHALGALDVVQDFPRANEFGLAADSSEVGRLVTVFFLGLAEIDWIEAAGNYVRVVTRERTHLMRSTLTQLEQSLDPAKFVRIHRSCLVARRLIREAAVCSDPGPVVK